MEINVEKVMDRPKIAETINAALDLGIELITKPKLEPEDKQKLKVLRSIGTYVSNGVFMVQQETAQQRVQVVLERMKQLGYVPDDEPKKITKK